MNYPEHIAVGLVLGIAILFFFNSLNLFSVVFVGLCSILPDIDHPKSKVSQLLYFLVFALSFIFIEPIIQKYFAFSISIVLNLLFSATIIILWLAVKPRHRGVTHSLLFAVAFAILAFYFYGLGICIAGLASYLSHIVLDKF